MEKMLHQAADGTGRGWQRWYALAHAARCPRCGRFLDRLRETLTQLRATRNRPMPEDLSARLKEGKWRDALDEDAG
ncbi:MAG: hypothetical protein JNM85_04120 [Chthonomonas sp.]|nr:hypothetical protein [Chthonomonas sp.]